MKNNNKCIKRIKKVYKGMKERCENKNHIGFKYYGAKGTKVLITRDDFVKWYLENVTFDMHRPSVDRIKSHLNYEISNIQLLSRSANSSKSAIENNAKERTAKYLKAANNKRKRKVVIDGVEYESQHDAARKTGISADIIRKKFKANKSNKFKSRVVTYTTLDVA